jgi:hypothetical protein
MEADWKRSAALEPPATPSARMGPISAGPIPPSRTQLHSVASPLAQRWRPHLLGANGSRADPQAGRSRASGRGRRQLGVRAGRQPSTRQLIEHGGADEPGEPLIEFGRLKHLAIGQPAQGTEDDLDGASGVGGERCHDLDLDAQDEARCAPCQPPGRRGSPSGGSSATAGPAAPGIPSSGQGTAWLGGSSIGNRDPGRRRSYPRPPLPAREDFMRAGPIQPVGAELHKRSSAAEGAAVVHPSVGPSRSSSASPRWLLRC